MIQSAGIITLLTDFGNSDVYVGVMKGVIASINSQLQVIDLTHEIPRQDIAAGRFSFMNAYPYFPPNTVHVGVVDPGVGSQRRAIAVRLENGYVVGPDNGLFSGIMSQIRAIEAVELTHTDYWLTPNPSSTFHGRDIFAPAGAYIASGVSLAKLGKPIPLDSLVALEQPPLQVIEKGLIGSIQSIDIFGNIITNIPSTRVKNKDYSLIIPDPAQKDHPQNLVIPLCQTYSDRPTGELVAIIGSHGWVEIAVNTGSAASFLKLSVGDSVQIMSNEHNSSHID